MKLIDILVRELPKHGGWIEGNHQCAQDGNGELCFYSQGAIRRITGHIWSIPECSEATHDGVSRIGIPLSDDWMVAIVTREQYESALAASKTEWDGEGLPPVGLEIEYMFTKVNYRTDFSRGKVLAYGMHNVFMEHWSSKNEFIQPLDKIEFRPIRSEADKKKEAAVFAIAELCRDSASNGHSAELIYDAIKSGKIVID